MIDVRCKNCNKLLAKADLMNAAIKCSRCSKLFEYHVYSNVVISNISFLRNNEKPDIIPTETTESARQRADK